MWDPKITMNILNGIIFKTSGESDKYEHFYSCEKSQKEKSLNFTSGMFPIRKKFSQRNISQLGGTFFEIRIFH